MKTILVTGATSGIGWELTTHLAKNNKVFAVGRNQEKLNELAKTKNVTSVAADVGDFDSLEKAFSKIEKLDVTINAAGILGPVGKLADNNLSEWEATIRTNLLGTVYSCKLSLNKLKENGKIINFAGGGAAYPRAFHTAYASSKAAVVRFTDSLASEYSQYNINVIAPGAHKTNIWKTETVDKEPKEWGDLERLKDFIDFLISEKSNGLTGRFLHYKDNWENLDPKKLGKDMFTLRRIEKQDI